MIFKKPDFLKSPLEHFRSQLEDTFQAKAAVFREKSVKKKLPFVYTLVFHRNEDSPMITFSYGLSFASHPDQHNKVELCLQMDSEDMTWAHVVGYLTNQLRGDCPFNSGEIIRLGQKVSQESDLNAFVVIPVQHGIPQKVKDGRKSTVQLLELIPIYEQEVYNIQKLGLDNFIKQLGKYKTDPKRKPL